jgi:hypothetical protein
MYDWEAHLLFKGTQPWIFSGMLTTDKFVNSGSSAADLHKLKEQSAANVSRQCLSCNNSILHVRSAINSVTS